MDICTLYMELNNGHIPTFTTSLQACNWLKKMTPKIIREFNKQLKDTFLK